MKRGGFVLILVTSMVVSFGAADASQGPKMSMSKAKSETLDGARDKVDYGETVKYFNAYCVRQSRSVIKCPVRLKTFRPSSGGANCGKYQTYRGWTDTYRYTMRFRAYADYGFTGIALNYHSSIDLVDCPGY